MNVQWAATVNVLLCVDQSLYSRKSFQPRIFFLYDVFNRKSKRFLCQVYS